MYHAIVQVPQLRGARKFTEIGNNYLCVSNLAPIDSMAMVFRRIQFIDHLSTLYLCDRFIFILYRSFKTEIDR